MLLCLTCLSVRPCSLFHIIRKFANLDDLGTLPATFSGLFSGKVKSQYNMVRKGSLAHVGGSFDGRWCGLMVDG